jgi:hypothetical protein
LQNVQVLWADPELHEPLSSHFDSICTHEQHNKIATILDGGEETLASIAERYGLSTTALSRPRTGHT